MNNNFVNNNIVNSIDKYAHDIAEVGIDVSCVAEGENSRDIYNAARDMYGAVYLLEPEGKGGAVALSLTVEQLDALMHGSELLWGEDAWNHVMAMQAARRTIYLEPEGLEPEDFEEE